jgi:hypothetical protein
MKHSFLMITISIIAVLTLVLCWQIYWLRGLYQSIRVETCATLTTAVEMADFNEIAYRMKMWEKEKKEKRKKHQPVKEHLVSVDYDFDIYAQSPYKLMRLTDGCIHKVLDSLEPINLRVFYQVVSAGVQKEGLASRRISSGISESSNREILVLQSSRYQGKGWRTDYLP